MIKCPHNEEITADTEMGVTEILHKDGTKCDLMNKSNVSPYKLAEITFENNSYDSPECIATLSYKNIAKKYANYINSQDFEDVKELLKKIDAADMFKFLDPYIKYNRLDLYMKESSDSDD